MGSSQKDSPVLRSVHFILITYQYLPMKEMWDKRYSEEGFAYGANPNEFLKEMLEHYQFKGSALFPAEGEGRNAVFAAQKGMDVYAFDISEAGRKKALVLAEANGVQIQYEVGNLLDLNIVNQKYDLAALIYAHFPPTILSSYHKKIAQLIKPGGHIILEAFSKNHLELRQKNPAVGGPPVLDMLFSTEMIQADFADFEALQLEEVEIELSEGKFHNGIGKVIRFVGRKK